MFGQEGGFKKIPLPAEIASLFVMIGTIQPCCYKKARFCESKA